MDIIVKCRQRGFTTAEQIDMLDDCLFIPNTAARVIAHNKDDAQDFFKGKIKFAYDNLPDQIKAAIPATSDAARELAFSNGSRISVGVSGRSGTYQRVHISEFGKLCAQRPDKAEEVITGVIPALAPGGKCTIESTAEGADGRFHDMSMSARKRDDEGVKPHPRQFKMHFYPWVDCREYRLPALDIIPVVLANYFEKLENDHNIVTDAEQQSWYVQEAETLGDKMKREHPSYFEEAFEASVEGAYFARQMAQIRTKGQICRVPVVPRSPVDVFMDLGRDTTAMWFMQKVGFDTRFIDYFENSGEGMMYYIKVLKDRNDGGEPYNYGDIYLPHDGTRRSMGSDDSPSDLLYQNNFSVRIVPRIERKEYSIEHARLALPNCWFDRVRCAEGIAALDNYRHEWDEKLGTWKNTPLHNQASHGSDAFQVFGDGYHHVSVVENEGDDVLREHEALNSVTGY